MTAEITANQLSGNVLHELEERDLKPLELKDKLDKVTSCLQTAIVSSRPDTLMTFIDAETRETTQMELSNIKVGSDGLPLISTTLHKEHYQGSMEDFIVFGWLTNSEHIYTAYFPNISFNLPEATN